MESTTDDERDVTEYLETWRRALEDRGMRTSRPKTQCISLNLDRIMAKEESQGKSYKECIILSISVQAWRRQEAWQHELHRDHSPVQKPYLLCELY